MIKLELKDDRLPTELPAKEQGRVYVRLLARVITIAVANYLILALVIGLQQLFALPTTMVVISLSIGIIAATVIILFASARWFSLLPAIMSQGQAEPIKGANAIQNGDHTVAIGSVRDQVRADERHNAIQNGDHTVADGRNGTTTANHRLELFARADNTVEVRDSGKLLVILDSYIEEITSAAFSADSKLILTRSRDGTARLWDTSGKLISIFEQDISLEASAISMGNPIDQTY